jgi:hypothetical protein
LKRQYTLPVSKKGQYSATAMVSRRQHAATVGTTLNRYLKNTVQLEMYLKIYTKEIIHIQQIYNQLDGQRGNKWFIKFTGARVPK